METLDSLTEHVLTYGAAILLDHSSHSPLDLDLAIIEYSVDFDVPPSLEDRQELAAARTQDAERYEELARWLADEAEERINALLGARGFHVEHDGYAGAWVVRTLEDYAAR